MYGNFNTYEHYVCTLESVTSMTSDGSGLEERIRLLKLQLQEMKRFQTEQKRKKKEILRQQEQQLKRKLEVSCCLTVGVLVGGKKS